MSDFYCWGVGLGVRYVRWVGFIGMVLLEWCEAGD